MVRSPDRNREGGATYAPPLWSHPLVVDQIPDTGLVVHIEADAKTRAALARLDGLPAITAASADLTVDRQGRERVRVRGRVKAKVTQICVVSLDPFEAEVDEPIDLTFERQSDRAREAAADILLADVSMDEISDPPDPIIDGRIDLGAVAAEFLALGLDPYPRKPGVEFDALEVPPEPPDATDSPFAGLAKIDSKPKG